VVRGRTSFDPVELERATEARDIGVKRASRFGTISKPVPVRASSLAAPSFLGFVSCLESSLVRGDVKTREKTPSRIGSRCEENDRQGETRPTRPLFPARKSLRASVRHRPLASQGEDARKICVLFRSVLVVIPASFNIRNPASESKAYGKSSSQILPHRRSFYRRSPDSPGF